MLQSLGSQRVGQDLVTKHHCVQGPVRDEAVSSTTLPFQAFSGTGLRLGE